MSAFSTPRAMPILVPSTSRPKIVPAQCVPWPWRSPLPEPEKSCCTSSTPWKAACAASMPVSRTAATTPAPVKEDRSARTASTPQAVVAAAPACTSNGRISRVGMTGAMPLTSGSRARLRTSLGVRSSTSILGSGGARVRASSPPARGPAPKGSLVAAPVRSRKTV